MVASVTDELTVSKFLATSLLRRQLQDHVGVALARAAQEAQPVDHPRLEPDGALALLVALVLEAHGAEREGVGDRLKRGLFAIRVNALAS